MIISFGGAEGSGKSTIAKNLASKLGWPRYYIGGMRREMAKKRGLTLAEYNKLGESDDSTDKEVDDYQRKLGQEEDNFIIEGRTSWLFIPHSLKIYMDVDPEIGAKRIFGSLKTKDDRNEDANLQTWQDVMTSTSKRLESDNKRYAKYYDINVHDKTNYDLVVDTSNKTIDEVLLEVEKFVLKEGKIRENK